MKQRNRLKIERGCWILQDLFNLVISSTGSLARINWGKTRLPPSLMVNIIPILLFWKKWDRLCGYVWWIDDIRVLLWFQQKKNSMTVFLQLLLFPEIKLLCIHLLRGRDPTQFVVYVVNARLFMTLWYFWFWIGSCGSLTLKYQQTSEITNFALKSVSVIYFIYSPIHWERMA